jgi:hypothetical protein
MNSRNSPPTSDSKPLVDDTLVKTPQGWKFRSASIGVTTTIDSQTQVVMDGPPKAVWRTAGGAR